ncbi:hypothetical protein J1N35_023487 [Gossypium stocksii]|uniref:DUF4283 domain-containing protein n=1 Tax=Gossypium stocksii TaxID=47602 RepID=A0A9D3VIW1_9ROSI|nr:hypothetical protein J1N35_023487 [Gossypium stocksii]
MEDVITGLSLRDGEDEAWLVVVGGSKGATKFEICLVGYFLTASVIRFEAMRTTMANLWHSIGEITIFYLGEKCFLFCFYVEMDIDRVIKGSPWTFNNHLLVFYRLLPGDDPLQVPLCLVDFWVQVHDIPIGYHSEDLARQFGNVLGTFLEFNFSILVSSFQHSIWDVSLRAQPYCQQPQPSVWLHLNPMMRLGGGTGSRGLSLGWKPGCQVHLQSYSSHHIDVVVVDDGPGMSWRITGFYESLVEQARADSWRFLWDLGWDLTLPWMVVGDFKEIAYSFEKRGGRLRSDRQIEPFERLDHCVVTLQWRDRFPTSQVFDAPHSVSNHCPLVIMVSDSLFGMLLGDYYRCFILNLVGASSLHVKVRLDGFRQKLQGWFLVVFVLWGLLCLIKVGLFFDMGIGLFERLRLSWSA